MLQRGVAAEDLKQEPVDGGEGRQDAVAPTMPGGAAESVPPLSDRGIGRGLAEVAAAWYQSVDASEGLLSHGSCDNTMMPGGLCFLQVLLRQRITLRLMPFVSELEFFLLPRVTWRKVCFVAFCHHQVLARSPDPDLVAGPTEGLHAVLPPETLGRRTVGPKLAGRTFRAARSTTRELPPAVPSIWVRLAPRILVVTGTNPFFGNLLRHSPIWLRSSGVPHPPSARCSLHRVPPAAPFLPTPNSP